VPWRFIGQWVHARSTAMVVQIFHNGQLIARMGASRPVSRPTFGHYPPEKVAFRMRTPTWCRTRAEQIGPACAAVIEACWRSTPCSCCAAPKVCRAWPTSTALGGWKPEGCNIANP
jgi:hypothetical protein